MGDYAVLIQRLSVSCPRDYPNQNDLLQLFQALTPEHCQFEPTKIWSRQTIKKNKPCTWCVLYVIKPEMNGMWYQEGTQGRDLRRQLNKSTPINSKIVDHEYYANTEEQGWRMVWKVMCQHQPDFHRKGQSLKEKGEL